MKDIILILLRRLLSVFNQQDPPKQQATIQQQHWTVLNKESEQQHKQCVCEIFLFNEKILTKRRHSS